MSYRLRCYTLFDITQTGVLNRSKPEIDQDPDIWRYKRNTQCNLDTLLQIISLRSQPELETSPIKTEVRFNEIDYFGFLFTQKENETYPCWFFDFTIHHPSVFNDGINELGYLYYDCDKVPMILCGQEWEILPPYLDCSSEMRNIFFEVLE